MSTTYRKKPVEIQALEWTGKNLIEIITFTQGKPDLKHGMASDYWDQYCDMVKRDGLIIILPLLVT